MENNFIETNKQYGEGIVLDVYKNEFGICIGNKGKDGNIYLKWVYPQGRDRNPIEKAIPLRISLGVKQQAIQRLEQLLMMIETS